MRRVRSGEMKAEEKRRLVSGQGKDCAMIYIITKKMNKNAVFNVILYLCFKSKADILGSLPVFQAKTQAKLSLFLASQKCDVINLPFKNQTYWCENCHGVSQPSGLGTSVLDSSSETSSV